MSTFEHIIVESLAERGHRECIPAAFGDESVGGVDDLPAVEAASAWLGRRGEGHQLRLGGREIFRRLYLAYCDES